MASKEWFKATHTPTSTTVTCTLSEDQLTVKWTVKTYTSHIKEGALEARKGAQKALGQLKEAVADDGD